MFAFASRRILNTGLSYVSQQALPRIVVGQVLGPAALGMYAVVRRLLDQLHGVLSGPAAAVAFPAVARMRTERERLHEVIAAAIRLTTWTVWPAVLGLAVVAPALLPLAFGPEWAAAVPVLQLLAIGTLRLPVASFNSAVLVGFGHLGAVSLISVASIAFGVPALLLGAQYGLVGVAAALAVRQWVMWPVGALMVRRACGFGITRQLAVLARAALPAVVMAAPVAALGGALGGMEPLPLLLCQVAAGLVLYALVWAAFNPRVAGAAMRSGVALLSGDVARARADLRAVVAPR